MILRVLDFECSGLTPPEAEVCEVGYIDLMRLGDIWGIAGKTHSRLCGVKNMPPQARAVHHISMQELDGAEPFDPAEVIDEEYAIVAHNADYEKSFMVGVEARWICSYKCSLRIWPDAPGHSNSVLRYWLEDQGLLSLDHEKAMPPHRAGPDAYVTAHILLALLKVATVEEMIKWSGEPRLLPGCPIGKFRGKPWAEVEWGFLNWMLRQPDMEEDLKWNARRELDRRASAVAEPLY